jgi:hypothetical protein
MLLPKHRQTKKKALCFENIVKANRSNDGESFRNTLAAVHGRTTFPSEEKVFQGDYVYKKDKGKWQVNLSQASLKMQ